MYQAGLYLRLSREDESLLESESIENQRKLLRQYVLEKGWAVSAEYIDDGYTGTNFERPGFQKMLRDIDSGKINCVITKDLSRLGRDYIETGFYLEKIFPKKHIRYIAISEGIDTGMHNSNSDITPFRLVVNDFYAKDISKKVRATFKAKVSSGAFIGAFAPYGYKKDPNNKNHLIIDAETAPVVRRIFELFNQGLRYTGIAKVLTAEGIESPQAYKTRIFKNSKEQYYGTWSHSTIKRILSNPTYMGHIAQGKVKRVSYKVNKTVAIPKLDWIVVKNTHEAIISQAIFDAAQYAIAQDLARKKKQPSLLSGILFCGECGAPMTHVCYDTKDSGERMTYICTKYQRFRTCSRHSIFADNLEKAIVDELQTNAQKILDYEKLLEQSDKRQSERSTTAYKREVMKIEKEQADIPDTVKKLYMDKLLGILSENDYLEQRKVLEQKERRLAEALSKLRQDKKAIDDKMLEALSRIKTLLSFEKLDKALLMKLIKRIAVFDDKTVVIEYNFQALIRH